MRRAVLALSLALAAGSAPASADELIRYRAPDGTLGLVDKAEKLPPGAEVLERTPLADDRGPDTHADPRAREEAGDEEAAPSDGGGAAEAEGGAGDAAGAESLPSAGAPRAAESAVAAPDAAGPADPAQADPATCIHLGLSRHCAPSEIGAARRWCSRGVKVQRATEAADAELAAAQEWYENCRTANGEDYCARDRLDAAEAAVEDSQSDLDELQTACRVQECLPGWIREGCDDGND